MWIDKKSRMVTLVLLSIAWLSCGQTRAQAASRVQSQQAVNDNTGRAASEDSAPDDAAVRAQISSIYRSFYDSYRLGTGDAIAVHVDKHPDDSVERVVVSPGGQIYYGLMGNVQVAGKTMPELQEYFSTSISEYIRDPRVTLTLLEANSAKVGVLGDVRVPGIVILSHPMRVLDAITAVGGITDTGSKDVSILRQYPDGRVQTIKVNMKRVLAGKAGPEENVFLNAGDTIVVHGNLIKKIQTVSSMMGIASFFVFLSQGR
ncbi:MAG TPA: polysaccharide biosynthesis/export family protein [Blastocatellia bacterium]